MFSKATFVLALACMVVANEALKCHVCTYANFQGTVAGEDCLDPYAAPTKHSQACASGVEYCTKITTGDMTALVRGCGEECKEAGKTEVSKDGQTGTIFCCKGDNCNAASALITPAWFLLMAPLAFIMY
jgi:hypothetical protein